MARTDVLQTGQRVSSNNAHRSPALEHEHGRQEWTGGLFHISDRRSREGDLADLLLPGALSLRRKYMSTGATETSWSDRLGAYAGIVP